MGRSGCAEGGGDEDGSKPRCAVSVRRGPIGGWSIPSSSPLAIATTASRLRAARGIRQRGARGPCRRRHGIYSVPPRPHRLHASAENLQSTRLTAATKAWRMIASCCATPMYVGFDDKRPWVSAFRARFGVDAPPVEMQICTRFRPPHPRRLPRVLLSRPVGALPNSTARAPSKADAIVFARNTIVF